MPVHFQKAGLGTCGAHLGNLHEVVHARAPEERQTRRKSVDVEACLDTGAEVIPTIGQGVGHLDVGGGTCFLHVVTRNGDAVELRHVLRGELEDVGDDAHRELRRIDIGVTHIIISLSALANNVEQILTIPHFLIH